MINVYIKSFNRPYFLDRCLHSMDMYLKGAYRIIIMDDGTPLKYIQRIEEKHPDVQFSFTDNAELKRKEIQMAVGSGLDSYTKSIPLSFWRNHIQHGSDIFLLWEDDIWFTETVDVDLCVDTMKQNNINLLKVRWWKNENTNVGKRSNLNNVIEEVVPSVNVLAESIVKNKFYLNSILNKLHLIKDTFFLQLYTYYEVGGVFFDKDYWLYLCPENQTQIEEMVQLGRAAEWKRKIPDRKYAKLIKESGRSTYLTSASGGYNDKTGFSMTMVNHYINEEWYNGRFDTMQNFPDNYSIETIYEILEKSRDNRCNPEKWKQWSLHFQAHFVSIGASPLG